MSITYLGGTGGFSSHPKMIKFTPRPRAESNSIDFSQSLTQILASLGHNLNANPKEGFDVISAGTDTWKETMTLRHNRQEERILNLAHQLSIMSINIQGSQNSLLKLQADFRRLDYMVIQHEMISPGLHSVLAKVNKRMEEFQEYIKHIRPTDKNTDIPMVIVKSLNELIQDNAPSATMEIVL